MNGEAKENKMVIARVNEVDLLRFFAALSVVFFHYTFRGYAADDMSAVAYPLLAPFATYGYLGVDLFFIISGFVIFMTASNTTLRNFFISRSVRLYPAFWACCTITFVLALVIGGGHFPVSVHQYWINMLTLRGAFGTQPMDGVYWSLVVEIRFYVLVAIALILNMIHRAQPLLIFWLVATIVIDVFPAIKMRSFLVADYSGYFIAGATCFLIWSQGLSLVRIGLLVASWSLALFQSLDILPDFEGHYDTSMNRYAVAVIVTAFFLVMLLVSLRRTGFLRHRRWLMLGALSYPLYLVHQKLVT
jgi:peptidoglycan/LPS O-acetylase OafA/YrhL